MSAEKGYIYVAHSASIPECYKIGCSTVHPFERAKQLSAASGVPTPFTIIYHRFIEFPFHAESRLHRMFAAYRVNDAREFFLMPLHQIVAEVDKLTGLPEPVREDYGHELDAELPWSRLFNSFPDDGGDRTLTSHERSLCADLARRLKSD